MKIITDNAVFVQKKDIAYLSNFIASIPASIISKIFKNGIILLDNCNAYEFIEFNEPEEINFFKNIDWMIDYNEIKDLSEEDILQLGQSIAQKQNAIAKSFNSMSLVKREQNMVMVSMYKRLDYKMCSLRNVLLLKQGYLKMQFPKGIDLPSKPAKGINKLVRSIFKKKN